MPTEKTKRLQLLNVLPAYDSGAVRADQGTANAGRVLVVGEDGIVRPHTDAETIALLIETDMLPAVHDAKGRILTDENGNVILRY